MTYKLSLSFPFAVVTIFTIVGSCVFTTPLAYWKLKDFQSYVGHPHLVKKYDRTPLIRKLCIRNAYYPDRLGSSRKYIENSKQLICHESRGYRMKYHADGKTDAITNLIAKNSVTYGVIFGDGLIRCPKSNSTHIC